jgi:hypothetical protein
MTTLKQAVAVALMVIFTAILLSLIYYFFSMMAGIRQEKRAVAQFLGPLILFMPHLFNEEGNSARLRTAICLFLLAVCFGAIAVTFKFL